MAKGSVTQEEFAAGLSDADGFSALKKAGAKRDSPFGKGKVLPKEAPPEKRTEVSHSASRKMNGPVRATQKPNGPTALAPATPVPETKGPRSSAAPAPRRFKDPTLEEVPFSFRGDYRDRADSLARQIQRRRRGLPGDRITACTLYRVFSELALESFEWRDDDLVQTEGELKELVRGRLGLGRDE